MYFQRLGESGYRKHQPARTAHGRFISSLKKEKSLTATFSSGRDVALGGGGLRTIATDADTTLTLNGTVSGTPEAIKTFVEQLRSDAVFDSRLDRLELKLSTATAMPFRRLKIRLKKEIVTLGDKTTDPTRCVGTYVASADWNVLLDSPDILLIDTRNTFEVAMGTFEGAINPKITRFSEFRNFVHTSLDPKKHKKIAMFCTGGIRCEKASSYMLSHGFEKVYHLQGGILKYLEDIPEARAMKTVTPCLSRHRTVRSAVNKPKPLGKTAEDKIKPD